MSTTEYQFPAEVIDLPSRGKCYPTDHPLSSGTIEIKYMTAKEEDILASQNLIKKGIALDKLFESVVISKGVEIGDIFVGDKNAILLATRILGYGSDYKVEVIDPFSGESQKVTIDLSKIKIKEVDFDKLNPENSYDFILPFSKTPIKYKLLTHSDEQSINADMTSLQRLSKTGSDSPTHEVTTRLRYMIIEVDGSSEVGVINKWINNGFLARDSRSFRNHIKTTSPDVELTYQFVSDLTGESEEMTIPFGINFFYPSE